MDAKPVQPSQVMNMIDEEELLNARILIVDDERSVVYLLEKILKAAGYRRIRSTTDPRQVPAIYAEYKPDLLLLDLSMPYLDGFEVMKELNSIKNELYLPILVLTAFTERPIKLRALESGGRDFLLKPFDRTEVLARIRNLLEARLLHKHIHDQNRILEGKVKERTAELRDTQLEIIQRLGRAAEYRDNETGLHIIRMSRYSALLGRAMGLGEEECELLLQASPMHDIGKIGIPDRILLKAGDLQAEEWEVVKAHTTIGADLLSGHDSVLLKTAHLIALTHHEKWDGMGYPRGLRGEEIPLYGRICALSDNFDALTSDRPYKKAWSVEEALAEIKSRRGKHFDPTLVDCFIRILPEILKIKDEYDEARAPHSTATPTVRSAGAYRAGP